MNQEETTEFLNEKPTYNCRFHPVDWWHEVGCPHRTWTVDELQSALDKAKRSYELLMQQTTKPVQEQSSETDPKE